ncbi:hypothetical protein C8F04DRAFT_1239558 [Mycena alexandri]|uniref:Uncharacterized protein n=1 Tax=Mycena alexandri TaxID=1745969 RepID=A0AAD6SFU3_9AGAR|nr:hypothetical protein C8F04DRAFT_1239558 [Mycena alexandri]
MTTARKPYSGPRTLVIGIDVDSGHRPITRLVLPLSAIVTVSLNNYSFPGQQDVGGDSKVPTSIFYSREGIIRSQGAETVLAEQKERAEDEGWELAGWFKLHLRPDIKHPDIPPLPHRMTAYLFDCAKIYIEQSHPDGTALWLSLCPNIRFVMTHPNGWEGKQQSQMRQAAVMAGLIPGSNAGHDRLQFVTEGEASLHFYTQNGLATEALVSGEGVVIVDTGGGTIDISTYHQVQKMVTKHTRKLRLHNVSSPLLLLRHVCSVRLDRLRNSRYRGDIENITEVFDTSAKLSFRGDEELSFIKFGSTRDDEPSCNIRRGQLRIPGCGDRRLNASSSRLSLKWSTKCGGSASLPVFEFRHSFFFKSVFVVGGFAANHYLFSQLKWRLQPHGLDVTRPDAHVFVYTLLVYFNGATADSTTGTRLSPIAPSPIQLCYGIHISEPFSPSNPEHATRAGGATKLSTVKTLFPPALTLFCASKQAAALDHFCTELWVYRGRREPTTVDVGNPYRWMSILVVLIIPPIYFILISFPEHYQVACTIQADTSSLAKKPTFVWKDSKIAYSFFRLEFDVILSFGLSP